MLGRGVDVVDTTDMEPSSAALTLRRARELAGLEPRAAAERLGLPSRQLRAYETGRWPVPAEVLSEAVAAYGSPEVVVPPRVSLLTAGDSKSFVVGAERVERTSVLDNRSLLRRYVAAVRRQRGLGPADPVEFRSADIVVLAGLLDLTDADLERQLRDASGSSGGAAHRAARAMVLSGLALLALAAVASCAATPPSVGGSDVGEPADGAAVVGVEAVEMPVADIGVAHFLERGGVQTVRTGDVASPAGATPGVERPAEDEGVSAEQQTSPETEANRRSETDAREADRRAEEKARREADRVARREVQAQRQAELTTQREARARLLAEQATARAEEQARWKAARRAAKGQPAGDASAEPPSATPP